MISHFWHAPHLRKGPLTSLYLTHSILSFGLGLIGIFIPIYIFQLTGNFYYLPIFYGITSVAAFISLLLSPKFLRAK